MTEREDYFSIGRVLVQLNLFDSHATMHTENKFGTLHTSSEIPGVLLWLMEQL